jgi:N-acetylglucosamine-6-phosphate deacetylase
VIENGTVYTPSEVIPNGVVVVDGQKIHSVGKFNHVELLDGAHHINARGGAIVPGFVDMHMHGVRNYDMMDGKAASLQAMSRILPRYGVAAFVPTTVTASLPTIEQALQAARGARNAGLPGAEMLGAHVEGPYLSAQERGAHRLDLLREPQPDDISLFLKYADIICSFTLAPELPGSLELIRALKAHGILVSAGHTFAIDEEMERAVDAGLSHVTHMFGNMGTLRRVNLRRVAGVVESTLLDDRLTTEIIGDGHHISPSLMKLVLKIKGPERLAIVTDASPLMGLPPGPYQVWGIDVILEESTAFVADRSAYAGSVVTLDRCLRRVIELTGISFRDALRMITSTPATILGVADRLGRLQAGKDAHVVVLDDALNVTHTLVAGKMVFAKTAQDQVGEGASA